MRDLNAIALFVEVVNCGSFSGAARKLDTPLSTISRKVAQLEDELGLRLLNRSTRKLSLTEVGADYFEQCRKGIEAFQHADTALLNKKQGISGTLHISVPPNLAETLFMPLAGQFQALHPEAKIKIAVTERILDLVEDTIDLSFRVCPVKEPGLVTRRLAHYQHRLLASPAYIATHDLPTSLDELTEHRLIGFGFWNKKTIKWALSQKTTTKLIDTEPVIAVNDYAAVIRAIELGFGIGEAPEILCQQLLKEKRLITVLPQWTFPTIELAAVHLGKKNMPPIARAFLDFCVENWHLKPVDTHA